MELLTPNEVKVIANRCGLNEVLNWKFEKFSDELVGYLSDNLSLIIKGGSNGAKQSLNLFVKCMPRFDKWKAEYLKEAHFFKKEYTMLSKVFNELSNPDDSHKWRPKVLFLKENLFVFENVTLQGYKMPNNQDTLTFEQLEASIVTLARFHAQVYIYEEKKSKELGRTYRLWEQYSDYLKEPSNVKGWRDAGQNAVIDFLKVYSKYKNQSNFSKKVEFFIPKLFDKALELMNPSLQLRNVVVHRDLWTNNIFLRKNTSSTYHAMFVDFQTIIYAPPMLDLSSLIYFNTSKADRLLWLEQLKDIYYNTLTTELEADQVNVETIFPKHLVNEAYEQSIVFGITQSCIITPITTMSNDKREEIFCDPDKSIKVNMVSRSEDFIEIAKDNQIYRKRITELFDELVERYVFANDDCIISNGK